MARPHRVSGPLLTAFLHSLWVFVGAAAVFRIQVFGFGYFSPGPELRPEAVLGIGLAVTWGPVAGFWLLSRIFLFGEQSGKVAAWALAVTASVAVVVLRLGPNPEWMFEMVRAHPPPMTAFSVCAGFISLQALLVIVFGRLGAAGTLSFLVVWLFSLATLALWLSMGVAAEASAGGARPFGFVTPMWIVAPLIGGGVLMVLSFVLLVVRYVFSFFTTVSIGGVMIGGMALIIVLSVMSGFENHLRSRILGSRAHILISQSDEKPWKGYQEVLETIRDVPGIVGSSPYLQSEVALAAKQSYATTVVKGIDPLTVGSVSDLENNASEPEAIGRLWPLSPDGKAVGPPTKDDQSLRGANTEALDPLPDEVMLPDEEPIDFTKPRTAQPGKRATPEVQDPLPEGVYVPDDEPVDFSGASNLTEEGRAVRISGPLPLDEPPMSSEVAVLPGVLVGREMVKHVNLFEGQEVKMVSPIGQDTPVGEVPRSKRLRVAGTFYTGMYQYDLKLVYVELGALQEFLELGDVVNGIEIRIQNPQQTGPVIAELRRRLGPDVAIKDWKAINRSLFSALQLEKIAMFIVLVITILVASFSIMGNLTMTVFERSSEIAVLKTLGSSRGGILRVFVIQGLCIGVVGTALGVSLGLTACLLNERLGVPIDPNVYYMDKLPSHVEPSAVVAVAVAGLVISVLATLYPAYVAARMDVVRGLRAD